MVSEISPIQSQDVNPFATKIHVVVDPRLTANIWYLVADRARLTGSNTPISKARLALRSPPIWGSRSTASASASGSTTAAPSWIGAGGIGDLT